MTDAERRLWSALRYRRLDGFRFRRQQQIGVYIVDFFCPSAKLIVEVDGGQHSEEEKAWYDYHRSKWLEARGYRVVRFTNYEVLRNTNGVVEALWDELRRPPIRLAADAAIHLPPQGGKG